MILATRFAQAVVASTTVGRPLRRASPGARRLVRPAALALVLAALIPAHAAAQSLGMWVWSPAAYSTREARHKLVRFCVRHRIDRLDIHVRFNRENGVPTVSNGEEIAALVSLADRNKISTAAVRGSPRMFIAGNSERTLAELRAIVALNRALGAQSLLRGVMYDVEPYLTSEWKAGAASRRAIMLEYLSTLRKIRSTLRAQAPRMWLAVDMPFWWDKDELHIEYRGKDKRFSEHVQDATDFVVLMSYRRRLGQVLTTAQNEMRYARQNNKVVFLALETNPRPQNENVSFSGLPPRALWNVVTPLLEAAQTDDAIGGLMLHSYRGLQVLSAGDRNPIIPAAE